MAKRVFTDESLEQFVTEIKNNSTATYESSKEYTDTKVKDLALADEVYAKTETYTQEEVDEAIDNAVTGAITWVDF